MLSVFVSTYWPAAIGVTPCDAMQHNATLNRSWGQPGVTSLHYTAPLSLKVLDLVLIAVLQWCDVIGLDNRCFKGSTCQKGPKHDTDEGEQMGNDS
jgi:hypothetical protein